MASLGPGPGEPRGREAVPTSAPARAAGSSRFGATGTAPSLVDANVLLGRHPRIGASVDTVADLRALMDRVGIDAAIVTHTASWLHDPATGNRQLIDLLAGEPRLRPCWVLLPDTCGEVGTPAEFVAGAEAAGVAAVRAYPADHGYDLAGADAAPMLDALTDAGLPLLVDAGQTSWPAIEAVAAARPDLPVLACQAGYRDLRRIAGVLARTRNVYLDVSYLATHDALEWLAARFGVGRLVFGTAEPDHDAAEAVTRLLYSGLDDAEVAAIGSGNLHHLLREPVAAA